MTRIVQRLGTTAVFYTVMIMSGVSLFSTVAQAQNTTSVTLLHFSDYHSSALTTSDKSGRSIAGIARLINYLKNNNNADTLIFSGGDMMNKGAPVWSDKYRCSEWPWLDGVIDAMALGNHDADYGPQELAACLSQINFPVLSANTLTKYGKPAFTHKGENYAVFELNKVKVGVFALAGNDFAALLKPNSQPVEDVRFADKTSTAKIIVNKLRRIEKVDFVVLIGHAHYEEDIDLAQEVDGIDLIFGSHSHRLEKLLQIPGTQTWFISAGQYLSHVAQVTVQFSQTQDGRPKPALVDGKLVAMNHTVDQDTKVAKLVDTMQAELERDPLYAGQFRKIGFLRGPLAAPHEFKFDSPLGNFVGDTVRKATNSDVAIFTSSTFRKNIPMGEIREHHLSDALPYDNQLHVYTVSGEQLKALLELSISRRGSDFFSQVSGLKIAISNAELSEISVQKDDYWAPLQPNAQYQLVTSDYQAKVATGYSEILAPLNFELHENSLRDLVRQGLQNSMAAAARDGRIYLIE